MTHQCRMIRRNQSRIVHGSRKCRGFLRKRRAVHGCDPLLEHREAGIFPAGGCRAEHGTDQPVRTPAAAC